LAGVLAAIFIPIRITKAAPDAPDSTLHRMEHALHKPVAWGILPLFGFANAGVTLGNASIFATLPVAIAFGLFLGKQVGIFGSIWLSVRLKIASKPVGADWSQIYGMAILCGIGFTMSLFIGGLAFPLPALGEGVKVGVLAGSLFSAIAGSALLIWAARARECDR
jgi:Na+:H+ antiporter, NhaA family